MKYLGIVLFVVLSVALMTWWVWYVEYRQTDGDEPGD